MVIRFLFILYFVPGEQSRLLRSCSLCLYKMVNTSVWVIMYILWISNKRMTYLPLRSALCLTLMHRASERLAMQLGGGGSEAACSGSFVPPALWGSSCYWSGPGRSEWEDVTAVSQPVGLQSSCLFQQPKPGPNVLFMFPAPLFQNKAVVVWTLHPDGCLSILSGPYPICQLMMFMWFYIHFGMTIECPIKEDCCWCYCRFKISPNKNICHA